MLNDLFTDVNLQSFIKPENSSSSSYFLLEKKELLSNNFSSMISNNKKNSQSLSSILEYSKSDIESVNLSNIKIKKLRNKEYFFENTQYFKGIITTTL